MAIKMVCDRCGAEINPRSSVTYMTLRKNFHDIADNEYELCCSCAFRFAKWFENKGGEADDR